VRQVQEVVHANHHQAVEMSTEKIGIWFEDLSIDGKVIVEWI